MRSLPCAKTVGMISPLLHDNVTATKVEVDTKDFKFARIVLYLGATDIALSALKLEESDSTGTGYSDITSTVFGTATDSSGAATTLPSATDDGKFYHFDVDLRGRKRFLRMVATAGDGSLGANMAAWCDLYGGSITPTNATSRGAAVVMKV